MKLIAAAVLATLALIAALGGSNDRSAPTRRPAAVSATSVAPGGLSGVLANTPTPRLSPYPGVNPLPNP